MIKELVQLSQENALRPYDTIQEWYADFKQFTKDKLPIEKAIIGGFHCQQFSFAFMAGYQAALAKMFPTIAPDELKALCVSEEKGGHPKAIQTTLINNEITGLKTYVTAGSDVANLLVLCKTNEIVDGKPFLKMVHLPKNTENIQINNFKLPFMQEVKHGKLTLKGTKINPNQILKGDGYSDYTKPFRTVEDICISTAYNAMLLRQAFDNQWDDSLRDQLLFNIYSLKNLVTLPPSDKETHLLLAAYEDNWENLRPAIELNISKHSPTTFQKDWAANKKLLSLSKKLKQLILSKARNQLFPQ